MAALSPVITQDAKGWVSPDSSAILTFDDLVILSGGLAVSDIGPGQYLVHEPITIMPSDTLMLMGGENVMFDPFMGIALEIEGFFDANMGMGATFHSAGPGSWQGIRIQGNGGMMANQLNIWDAVDGIYADHSFGFGMMQIDMCTILGCSNTGITMIGTMGGPGINMNMIQGCDIGIYLKDTSAQCFNDQVMDCNIGIMVEGDFGPMINMCQIENNYVNGIYLKDAATVGIMASTFRNNFGEDTISLYNSSANIDGNSIYSYNASGGSGESGRNGIVINGTVEWGQSWISNNWIFGGHGDEGQNGGHAILIEELVGNASNGWTDNIMIQNNNILQGGAGGMNALPGGRAGDGGSGILVLDLPNEEDWLADEQSVIIENNLEICGGGGGDSMDPTNGFAGNGGNGICVFNSDGLGNIRITDNGPIEGGDGGINMAPMAGGAGGSAISFEDVTRPGSRVGGALVFPGSEAGPVNPGFRFGGMGIKLENCSNFDIWNVSGNTQWYLLRIDGCFGDISTSNISIEDSDINMGGLVKITNTTSNGTHLNWSFSAPMPLPAMPLPPVIASNVTSIHVTRVVLAPIAWQDGMVLDNCNDWELSDIDIDVTDGTGLYFENSENITLMNANVTAKNGSAVKLNNTNGSFMVDSFFDVEYNITFPSAPTGILIENSSRATIRNSTVTVKNGSAINNKKSNGTFMVDSFFDVEYEIDFPDAPNILTQNSTNTTIQNSTIRNGKAGILVNNCSGLIILNNSIVAPENVVPGYLPWREGVNIPDDDVDEDRDGIPAIWEYFANNTFENWNVSINLTLLGDCGNRCYSIANNSIFNSSGAGVMINLNRAAGDSIFDLNFEGNNISNCGIGLDIFNTEEYSSPHPDDVDIFGNHIARCDEGVTISIPFYDIPSFPIEEIPKYTFNANTIEDCSRAVSYASDFRTQLITSLDPDEIPPTVIDFGKVTNIFDNCTEGLFIVNATFFSVDQNHFQDNDEALIIKNSAMFLVRNGIFENNNMGISLVNCTNGSVYHNNFINNAIQAQDDGSTVLWDNGYPSGGNYWSDYGGVDVNTGPLQDQPGADGLGDTPYIIDGDSSDMYPLITPWNPLLVPPQGWYSAMSPANGSTRSTGMVIDIYADYLSDINFTSATIWEREIFPTPSAWTPVGMTDLWWDESAGFLVTFNGPIIRAYAATLEYYVELRDANGLPTALDIRVIHFSQDVPHSHVDPITPYNQSTSPVAITATVTYVDAWPTSNVSLYYRYSTDNSTWGSWILFEVDETITEWEWDFDFPGGDGYYRFYSRATNSGGVSEWDPNTAFVSEDYSEGDISFTSSAPASSWDLYNGQNFRTFTNALTPGWQASDLAIDIISYMNTNYAEGLANEDVTVTKYDSTTGLYQTCYYWAAVMMWWSDFALAEGDCYIIEIASGTLSTQPRGYEMPNFEISSALTIDLYNGQNFRGLPVTTSTLASEVALDVISYINANYGEGLVNVDVTVTKYDSTTGLYTTCYYWAAVMMWWSDFAITPGDGYIIEIASGALSTQPRAYTPS